MKERPPHPGRTPAQREAFDAIGCGDNCPPMHRKTRDALLEAGLIVRLSDKVVGRDRFGDVTVPQYEMPVGVHMRWCDAVEEEIPSDGAA